MKRPSRLACSFLLAACTVVFATRAHADLPQERDVVKKEYVVRPGGTLHLDMDHGQFEVKRSSAHKVLIELERVAKAEDRGTARQILEQHTYGFDRKGDDVFIRSRFSRERGLIKLRKRRKLKIRVTVRVPDRYNVQFSNGAGNVDIVEVEGRISGRTGAGNITIDDVRGVVDISSGAGNIDVSGDIAAASVRTGAGNITLYGLRGAVDASTGAGNILAVITHQPRKDSRLHSGAGNVTVELPEDINVYVNATTALGSAECDYPLHISKKLLKESFSGRINGDGPEIRMSAGVGNVSLRRN